MGWETAFIEVERTHWDGWTEYLGKLTVVLVLIEGVLVAKKDFNLEKHQEIETRNLFVWNSFSKLASNSINRLRRLSRLSNPSTPAVTSRLSSPGNTTTTPWPTLELTTFGSGCIFQQRLSLLPTLRSRLAMPHHVVWWVVMTAGETVVTVVTVATERDTGEGNGETRRVVLQATLLLLCELSFCRISSWLW